MVQLKKDKVLYRGSAWRRCDLQIHTYFDANWKWPTGYPNGHDKQRERIAKFNTDFIQHCISKNIDLVAITDHNTGEAIDGLIHENNNTGNKVTILPGVEVISSEGIHLIIIFNPDKTIPKNRWSTWKETVDHFLTAIFIDNPRFEDQNGRNTPLNSASTINGIIIKTKEYYGLTIFPHIFARGTGVFSCNSRTRKKILHLCNILDLACDVPEITRKSDIANRNLSGQRFAPQNFALIRTSDARSINDVGSKFTWIKADATFNGLKQIIYEPKSRVCIGENSPLYHYTQLVSAKLLNTKGYQSQSKDFPPISINQEVFFSPNLTTIVGPRAVGKTVLVEMIGYVINKFSSEKKDKKLPLIDFLSEEFSDLEIEVSYQSGAEGLNTLSRKVSEHKDPFYSPPLKVEYWTQGEIEKKADSPKQIADYIGDKLRSDLLISTAEKIKKIYTEMQSIRSNYAGKLQFEIENAKLAAERKQIEAYFDKLKSKEYKEIVTKIKDNRAKREIIDGLLHDIENQTSTLRGISGKTATLYTVDKNKVIDLFKEDSTLKAEIKEFYHLGEVLFDEWIKKLEGISKKLTESHIKKTLDTENANLNRQFSEYCRANGITITKEEYQKRNERIKSIDRRLSIINNSLKILEGKKQYHAKLETQLMSDLKAWATENNRLLKEFNVLFEDASIVAEWENPRSNIAEWIKSQFLESNSMLKDLIEESFKMKSPIREDYLDEIVKELVRKHKKNVVARVRLALSKNQIPSLLEDSTSKKETLRWFFEDENTQVIREDLIMRLGEYAETGRSHIKYGNKVLGKDPMSFGERCGTLVELILMSGDHPLIIDQPEDHLDAKFVAEKVVTLIREQKIKRQVIICTHNANIVVLGDSELVTALSVEDSDNVKILQMSLENSEMRRIIYDVLEGGETAFRKREQKYTC